MKEIKESDPSECFAVTLSEAGDLGFPPGLVSAVTPLQSQTIPFKMICGYLCNQENKTLERLILSEQNILQGHTDLVKSFRTSLPMGILQLDPLGDRNSCRFPVHNWFSKKSQ